MMAGNLEERICGEENRFLKPVYSEFARLLGKSLAQWDDQSPSKSPDEQFRSAVRHALPKCNGILKNICGASLTKSEPGPSTFLPNRETLVSPICSRILSDCVLSLAKNLDPWVRRFRSQYPDEQFTFAAKPVLPL
jgi:hypothetical protein